MIGLLFLLVTRQSPSIDRDDYGVPHIHADSLSRAFFEAGYAVAQDRLWQMDMSRRLARGRLAEVLGPAYVTSDREVLSTGYTDGDLAIQWERLSPTAKAIFESYSDGVNAYIASSTKFTLPDGYHNHGFRPERWSTADSVAICVHLLQQFGRGGAGEIRNMAALAYLQGQKPIGKRVLDVWDDIAWFNDRDAIPTVNRADDVLANSHPTFYQPDRKATEAHIARLPKLGLLQLMGGIRVSSREESTRVAESLSTPFHSGSYCMVVGTSKSGTGHPALLSGPQMGMRVPSIVHEMSIQAPGLDTVGMDVPGVPGVVVGHTKTFAWGLTSGVADTDDIFFFPSDGSAYLAGDRTLPIEKIEQTLKVKGGKDITVVQSRTIDGPVVMTGGKTIFAKNSSYRMREMETFEGWLDLWRATTTDGIEKAMEHATMNFNFFYATISGDIGWRFLGLIPKRASGIDPRFPTPGDAAFAWQGTIPIDQMPHVRNPKAGFLANWNNKPVEWWPNFDTPAWGKIFRNSALLATLSKPKLTAQDLEMSAWTIARSDENWPFFKPYIDQARGAPGYDLLEGYDGRALDGSRQASNFEAFMVALRKEIFLKTTGSFVSPEFFNLVLQPSILLRALEHKTKFDYLAGRTTQQVIRAALADVVSSPAPPYKAPTFPVLEPTPVPYSNRGTYIQIVEFLKDSLYGRNVLPPGVAESGPHANDQTALARGWLYKPMRF